MTTPAHQQQPYQGYPGQPEPSGQPYPGWQPPAEPPKKSHKGRNWILGIIGVFVVIGVITAIVSPPPDDTATVSDKGSSASAGSSQKNDAKKNQKKPEKKAAGIGDQARDGKFTFIVTKIGSKSQVGDQYLNKKAQGQFILVSMAVTNHGDEAQSMFGDNQYLYSADGKKFSADTEAAIYLGDQGAIYDEINPGNTLKGIVVFDVPKGFKADHLELHDSAFSDGVDVQL